jgi:glycosyltransferase involved in cell wall biosynthesis
VKIPIKYPVRLYRVDKHSAGGARNVGLENATGEWITFWDSDDYVRPREIVEILNSVTSNSTVVVSEFDVEDYESALKSRQSKTRDLVDLVETLGWWRLAFRRSRIGDMRVSELNMGEDQVFVAGLLLDENEIYYSHKLAYTYVINRKNQITGNRRYHKDLLASLIQMKEILKVDKHSHLYVLGLFLRLGITGLIRMKGKDRRKISRIVVTYLMQEGHLFRRDFYRIVARLVTGHLRKVV